MNLPFSLLKDKDWRENEESSRGYRMITTFDIENFRCFEHLHLENLRTINIIVGDNGSGKTALLEALLLSAYAHPGAFSFIRLARKLSLPREQVNWDRNIFMSMWEDVFFNFQDSKLIKAKFTDSLYGKLEIEVQYVWPESAAAFLGGPIPHLMVTRFESEERKRSKKAAMIALLKINEQGRPVVEGPTIRIPPVYILPSTNQFLPEEMVIQYGELSKRNMEVYVTEILRKDFPKLSNIQILPDGSGSGLFVKMESIPKKKIPLASVSAGAARYLNMLMSVLLMEKGIVLVDEIENGIYWKKMPNIWKRLRELCVERGVQLFATTHSDECLQSLIEGMQEHEVDFSLIRTTITDGKGTVEQFAGRPFLAALEGHGEVR